MDCAIMECDDDECIICLFFNYGFISYVLLVFILYSFNLSYATKEGTLNFVVLH